MKLLEKYDYYKLSPRNLCKSLIKNISDVCAIISSFIVSSYLIHYLPQERIGEDIFFLSCSSLIISYLFGFHYHLWRMTSLYNIIENTKFVFLVTLFYLLWRNFHGDVGEELFKFFLIFAVLSFMLINLPRVITRIFYEENKAFPQGKKIKVILIGAGKGGELFLRETRKRKDDLYSIEGILDDDPDLWGKKVFGIKVYGPIKDLPKLMSYGEIDMAMIAIPSLSQERLVEITKMAEDLSLSVKVLPSFDKLLTTDNVALEDISVEALLGRDSVNLEKQEVISFVKDKVILVTGAGGSIGAEICRQLIQLNPHSILLMDHSEYNLYKIAWELENTHKYRDFIPILANVTDKKSLQNVFTTYSPHIIFHAAAYKHVPLLENQVTQAVQNNFFGTRNIAELSSMSGCEKFILISTDKAVNPTNIMGTTKRMAEVFCQHLNKKTTTKYITVRFGNVLDSAGSVIPLFKKQLQKGGPLTVTHPEITRFFMSIPEASQLVLQAGAMGQGGEIFVLDMGHPIKIIALAERLITLSNKRPYKDIDIIFTGLRPGEKLYEELFYENEIHMPTSQKKILLAQTKNSNSKDFMKYTETLESYLEENNIPKILDIMIKMVPEAQLNFSFAASLQKTAENQNLAYGFN